MNDRNTEHLTNAPSLRHHLREHWLAAFLLGIILSTAATLWQYQRFLPNFNQQLHAVMSVAAPLIEQAMISGNNDQVSSALIALTNHPDIIYGVVVDGLGQRIAKVNRSPQQRSTRWLTETLFGINYPMRYEFDPHHEPANGNKLPASQSKQTSFPGYVQIEIDTNSLAQAFLYQMATTVFCILIAALILATLISWLTYFHSIRPLDNIIKTLIRTDIYNPTDHQITHDEMVVTPSLSVLTQQINQLLEQVSTNVLRRERAEDDLRKNLASLDYIVAERTEALRGSNKRLQTLVTNMEARIEQTETIAQLRLDFLAIMGHEIKTNLSSLCAILTTEIDHLQNILHTQNLEVIDNSKHFFLQMIDDILELSRHESSTLKRKHRQFNLGELIEQITSLHHAEARLKGVALYSVIPPKLPYVFIGDESRLRQILNTLTLNILKFSNHGEVRLSVTQKDTETVIIRIRASGISITADAFKAIFKPISHYVNLDAAVSLNDWGLSLVNRLLGVLSASVESELDAEWGELVLTIPLAQFISESQDELQLDLLKSVRVAILITKASPAINVLHNYLEGWSIAVHIIDKTLSASPDLPADKTITSHTDSNHHTQSALHFTEQEVDQINNCTFCITDDPHALATLNEHLLILNREKHTHYLLLAEPHEYPMPDRIHRLGIANTLPLPLHRRPLLATLLLHALQNENTEHHHVVEHTGPKSTDGAAQKDEKELHVLVVEDNLISATVCKTLLRRLHCRTLNAHNGVEALELIPSGPFDLILMDCHMPEMDGYEATALIRESVSEEKLPIIALTTDTSSQNLDRCRQAGMNDLVQKPCSQDSLAFILNKWCRSQTLLNQDSLDSTKSYQKTPH